MKSLLKRALRTLLRPLVRKLEGRLSRLIEATVRPLVIAELDGHVRPALEATTAAVRESIERTDDTLQYLRRNAQENTLLLDSLVRELVRVQMQLDHLEPLTSDPLDHDNPGDRHDPDSAPFAIRKDVRGAERLMIG